MVLLSYVNAWDIILKANRKKMISNRKLFNDLKKKELIRESFDNFISMEFPHGTDEDELIEFFNGDDKYIREHI